MEITKENNKIKKVLHRLISEETTKIQKCLTRINYLSHQAENYDKMLKEIKDEVKQDMFILMQENGWDDWITELKEELDKD